MRRQYRRLAAALPGVDLHYALKPLPHASVINTLHAEGAFFDLATNGEVELVRRLKVAPERCIHTHPIKRDSDIRTALAYGVDRFVVDNPDELRKFVKYRNRSSLLIRISFRSPEARSDLSRKFGCEPEAVSGLLRLAGELRIKVDGTLIPCRIASGRPGDVRPGHRKMRRSHADCRRTDGARSSILDIGGGFPGGISAALHAHRGILRSDSRGAGGAAVHDTRDRGAGPLHCRAGGDLGDLGHGPSIARPAIGGTTSTTVCTAVTAGRCTTMRTIG